MRIIAISGKARHGKDTAARIIKEELENSGERVLIAHYGDLPKYICRTFFNWDGIKDGYGRQLLQFIGTDVVRQQSPNYWVDFIIDMIKFFPGQWDWVLIPDTRFPNEVEELKRTGCDVTHLRIKRDGFESPLTPEQQQHSSETALDNYGYDTLILNDGTIDDFRTKIIKWMKETF